VMPPLPGAQYSSVTLGLWASFQQMACSRPPPPTTKTFIIRSSRAGGQRPPLQNYGAEAAAGRPASQSFRHRRKKFKRSEGEFTSPQATAPPGRGGQDRLFREKARGVSAAVSLGTAAVSRGDNVPPRRALMVEQSYSCKRHDHIVLIGGGDDLVVPDGAAGL